VPVVLDRVGGEALVEEVPSPAVPLVETPRVGTVEAAHAVRKPFS